MKLACSTDLLIPLSDDLDAAVHKAAERHLHGLAISLTPASPFHMGILSPGNISFLKEARAHHVKVMCLYGLTLFGREPEAEKSYLKKAVCYSHAVGSELVSLRVGFKPGERPPESLREIIAESADFAEDLDVCLGIEPRIDSAVDSLSSALDLIDSVNSSHFGLVYNPAFHRFSEEKMPINAAEVIKSYLLMVVLTPEEGTDPEETHRSLLLLHKAGFEDYVLCHAEGHEAEHLSEAAEQTEGLMKYLKELEKEDRFTSC
ncbi:TIM barrel protein [bacterium]|nr:TIM barrel protein [bacterium]